MIQLICVYWLLLPQVESDASAEISVYDALSSGTCRWEEWFLTFKVLKSSCLFCRKADAPSPLNEKATFVPHFQSLNRRLDHLDENVERLWSKLSTKDEASNSLALGKVGITTQNKKTSKTIITWVENMLCTQAVPCSGELHRFCIPPGERSGSVGCSTLFSSEAGWSCEETFWLKQLKMWASIFWDETIVSETFSLSLVQCTIVLLKSIMIANRWFFVLETHVPILKYNIV